MECAEVTFRCPVHFQELPFLPMGVGVPSGVEGGIQSQTGDNVRAWQAAAPGGTPCPREALLTWEAVIIKITQAGNALPKVCIVGTISGQGQLFLKGSLGNRMEVEGKKEGAEKHSENSEHHPLRAQPWTGNSWAEPQTQMSFLIAKPSSMQRESTNSPRYVLGERQ